MGQYHQFMNFDKKEILQSSYGIKLMEWSYQKNDLLLQVEELLKSRWKGDRVLVVGDYVDEFYDNSKASKLLKNIRNENSQEQTENIYYYQYKELKNKVYPDKHLASRYIYNHNKKEYVDLKRQPVQWIYYEPKENRIYGAKIHPLSLLLSCSNGAGGGDYRGKNEGYVGEWIEDSSSLEFLSEPLNVDYEELDVVFDENKEIEDNISRIVGYMLDLRDLESVNEETLKKIEFDNSFYFTQEEKQKVISLVLERIKNKEEVKELGEEIEK